MLPAAPGKRAMSCVPAAVAAAAPGDPGGRVHCIGTGGCHALLARLAATGVRRLVVVPLSFVSDHIETLYELDQLYADLARRHGITHYYRARAFNGDPEFAQVLHSILMETQTC